MNSSVRDWINIFKSPLNIKSLFRPGRRGRRIPGTPRGMDRRLLNDVCLSHFNDSIKAVSYVHLSGWKASGAYLLLVYSKTGKDYRLVHKNSIYDLSEIPALEWLPVKPGPIEYTAYSRPQGILTKYLPNVYLCQETIPGIRYEYLLEDLSYEYQMVSHDNYALQTIIQVVEELPILHATMDKWVDSVGQKHLPLYDQRFSLELQKHARTNLELYYHLTLDSMVAEVLKKWSHICKVHGSKEFHEIKRSPIHGDLNTSNIWIRKHDQRLKVVDWEWAGLGLEQADLASLLKTTSPKIESKALKSFTELSVELSPTEHRRIYHRCKLERGLLDGSFMAAQYTNTPKAKREMKMAAFVRDAMHRILKTSTKIEREL